MSKSVLSTLSVLPEVVEDKKVLQAQIESLGARVEQISQAVEAGAAEATGEISELQQERLDAVRRLKEQMAKIGRLTGTIRGPYRQTQLMRKLSFLLPARGL